MRLELLPFQATAPGASGAAAAVAAGGNYSAVTKNCRSAVPIVAAWGTFQTAGWMQWTSASMHDMVRGYRANVMSAEPDPRLPLGLSLNAQPQETQLVTIAGSVTAGDVETVCGLLLYEGTSDQIGAVGRYASWDQVRTKMDKLTTVSATLTGAATGRTGSETIIAESDLLKANRNYALLGITTNTTCPAVWVNGQDTGNVDIGVPGDAGDNEGCQNYFVTLSRAFGRPMIPVINSANKAATFVGFIQDENNISPLVTLYLALLD